MAQLILACGLLSILNFPVISAVPFEITLYSEPNFTGQNTKIRLTDTNPDFECVSKAIGGVGSYCSVGSWVLKSKDISADVPFGWVSTATRATESCVNTNLGWENVTGITRVGPLDTATPAVTFKDYPDSVRVIDNVAHASLNIPNYGGYLTLVFTGKANWTFFEGPNFEGKSICWRSNTEIEARGTSTGIFAPGSIKSFGSVIRSCDLSAEDMEEFEQKLRHRLILVDK